MKQIDTIILVKNITLIKNFYLTKMNLEILHDWESMVVFKNRLAFHQYDLLQPSTQMANYFTLQNLEHKNTIIYLSTDKLSDEYNRIEKLGIRFIHGIVEMPWQRIFRIKDIEGNIVEIGEET